MGSEVKWSEVKGSDDVGWNVCINHKWGVKWSEVKGSNDVGWNVCINRKWGVKCKEMKWSEGKWRKVMMLGNMFLLIIYSNVAVCRLCAVPCQFIICFYFLLSHCSTCFLILFLCLFPCFAFLFSILCVLYFVYCFSFCIQLSPFLLLYKSTDHCHLVETQLL